MFSVELLTENWLSEALNTQLGSLVEIVMLCQNPLWPGHGLRGVSAILASDSSLCYTWSQFLQRKVLRAEDLTGD